MTEQASLGVSIHPKYIWKVLNFHINPGLSCPAACPLLLSQLPDGQKVCKINSLINRKRRRAKRSVCLIEFLGFSAKHDAVGVWTWRCILHHTTQVQVWSYTQRHIIGFFFSQIYFMLIYQIFLLHWLFIEKLVSNYKNSLCLFFSPHIHKDKSVKARHSVAKPIFLSLQGMFKKMYSDFM